MTTEEEKKGFQEAVANMAMEASPFYREYVFYMHLLAQCHIVFDKTLPAPAGVAFTHSFYTLFINPSEIVAEGETKEGKKVIIPGYHINTPLEHRIGILKHEMLHIALGHLFRKDDRNHLKFNYATDCALNQQITREHLPEGCIYPDNFPTKEKNVIKNESSEYYYSIMDDTDLQEDNKSEGEGENDGDSSNGGNGSGNNGNGSSNGTNSGNSKEVKLNDHSSWDKTVGDSELQQELTKNMVERSAATTQKGRGNLPSNYAQIIDNLVIKREVDWKRVLRQIVGNKKANVRKTLLRRDRRLPFANWIKGKTKDRIFELAVISDVSGSVSNEALMELWGEIINICEVFKTPVTMVQVDTQPSPPEKLTRDLRTLERKAQGGTYLSPALEEFKKNSIHYDALVITTDGYLFEDDIEPFINLRVPVIWLIEKDGQIMPEMNQNRMRAIKLKSKE